MSFFKIKLSNVCGCLLLKYEGLLLFLVTRVRQLNIFKSLTDLCIIDKEVADLHLKCTRWRLCQTFSHHAEKYDLMSLIWRQRINILLSSSSGFSFTFPPSLGFSVLAAANVSKTICFWYSHMEDLTPLQDFWGYLVVYLSPSVVVVTLKMRLACFINPAVCFQFNVAVVLL